MSPVDGEHDPAQARIHIDVSAAGFAALVGGFAGVVASGALIAAGVLRLDGLRWAVAQYGVGLALAALLSAPARWRAGARPPVAVATLALVLTFAVRRWLTAWVNLQALEWGSGPAGRATALVFPLVGLILGAALGADAGNTAARVTSRSEQ
ncbi:MAG: hypothetical protein M3O36_13180 [Myxococcota bacterium]|nr:hypothetical protein [Myxococcota bacterium]